jgi:cohesin complex subunit SA-1/2
VLPYLRNCECSLSAPFTLIDEPPRQWPRRFCQSQQTGLYHRLLCAKMTSSDAALASSPPATQETSDRRKSGRAVRKPDLFAEEHHEGSLLSDGSVKRKRQPNGDTFADEGDDEPEDEESAEESDGLPDEEELKERNRKSRNKKGTTRPTTKRPRVSNGTGTTLAIRSANVPSKNATQKAKVQKARSRQSQVNQEGLYGTPPSWLLSAPLS